MRRCCDSIPTSPSSIVARSGASPRRSTPWDPLSNRRQKLPSTGYIATIGNEPAQIPASPKQIRPVAILHPHLASRFPPRRRISRTRRSRSERRVRWLLIATRKQCLPWTVVPKWQRRVLLQPQHDFDVETFQRGLIVAWRTIAKANNVDGRSRDTFEG
jgi:hypothetical protein